MMENDTSPFLKEPGRAKETHFNLTASLPTLKKLKAGDLLHFKSEGNRLLILDSQQEVLGEVDGPDLRQKIGWALKNSIEVWAAILERNKKTVSVLIKTGAAVFPDEPDDLGEDLRFSKEGGEEEDEDEEIETTS